ncbi:hypothetical protein [Enterococcus canintestini]|uniref:hypothetical protein n=1 Tax=Enterococcus canintestini TaxID=317010 RepID=UPI0039917A2B
MKRVLVIKVSSTLDIINDITDIPKATVQAAIGGIPFALGISNGEMMLTVAVLSILITAPVGAFLIDSLYKRTLI